MKFEVPGWFCISSRGDVAAHAGEGRDHLAVVGDEGAAPINLAGRARVGSGDAAQQTIGGIDDGGVVRRAQPVIRRVLS